MSFQSMASPTDKSMTMFQKNLCHTWALLGLGEGKMLNYASWSIKF